LKVYLLLDYPPARVNFGITLGGVVGIGGAGAQGGGRGRRGVIASGSSERLVSRERKIIFDLTTK